MDASFIATVAVIVFIAIFLIVGFARGFLRIILTTFSLVITLVLAGTLAGPLADYAQNGTVIGPRIEKNIKEYIDSRISPVNQSVQNVQDSFIDALPLTASMKADLKEQNTAAAYVEQGVSDFSEYLAKNLATIVIKILSYILLFIAIFFLIRIILRISNLINHVPVLGGINRLAGAVFGAAEGVLFLWIICLIIMMLSGTEFGISCQEVIGKSGFLKFIYENNLLMSLANNVLGLFKL